MTESIHQMTYSEILRFLDLRMLNHHKAFRLETNPAWILFQKRGSKPLIDCFGQYCHLPKTILKFLQDARSQLAAANWCNVVEKLNVNIAQETGEENHRFQKVIDDPKLYKSIEKKSHYQILIQTLKKDFGVDFSKVPSSTATNAFLEAIANGILTHRPAYVGGVIFGLEHTACPELEVVYKIISAVYTDMKGKPLDSLLTKAFFELHVDYYEKRHDLDLKFSLQGHINEVQDRCDLYDGFSMVLQKMDQWWEDICRDAERA